MNKLRLPLIRIALVVVLCSSRLFSQEDERNYLGTGFGGSDFHLKDAHASPLIFSSIGIAPTLQYMHRGEENRQYAEASYYYDNLATTADNFHTVNHRARGRYSYLHAITDIAVWDNDVHLFLGGSVSSFLCHSDYFYLYFPPSYGRTTESWYWSNSLDLSFQAEYSPAQREFLSAQFFIPLVSNVSRPQYSPSGDYNYTDNDWKFKMFGKSAFLTKNLSLNTFLAYQRPIIGSFNVQLSYEFHYSIYHEPVEIAMYMNNIRAGLFYCF